MVQFHKGTLFTFDFLSNFLKSLLATHYYMMLFCLSMFRRAQGIKDVPGFPKIFSFNPNSSMKVLSTNTKNVSHKYDAI